MDPAPAGPGLSAYVAAASAALGLSIAPGDMAETCAALATLIEHGNSLLAFPLPPETEPPAVYMP